MSRVGAPRRPASHAYGNLWGNRVALDFAAARDRGGRWSVYALEMNIRKDGTNHPYTTLRSLVPGRYDPGAGRWIAEGGTNRAYSATDNLVFIEQFNERE